MKTSSDAVSTHGHTILHWLAATPMSIDALRQRVHSELGAAARFHICSASDLELDGLLAVLAERGRIADRQGLLTVEASQSCSCG